MSGVNNIVRLRHLEFAPGDKYIIISATVVVDGSPQVGRYVPILLTDAIIDELSELISNDDHNIIEVGQDGKLYALQSVKSSIENDNGSAQLVGDVLSPTEWQFYGTNAGGNKGFHDIPIVSITGYKVDLSNPRNPVLSPPDWEDITGDQGQVQISGFDNDANFVDPAGAAAAAPIQTVTGTTVDNTDSENPVVNPPSYEQLANDEGSSPSQGDLKIYNGTEWENLSGSNGEIIKAGATGFETIAHKEALKSRVPFDKSWINAMFLGNQIVGWDSFNKPNGAIAGTFLDSGQQWNADENGFNIVTIGNFKTLQAADDSVNCAVSFLMADQTGEARTRDATEASAWFSYNNAAETEVGLYIGLDYDNCVILTIGNTPGNIRFTVTTKVGGVSTLNSTFTAQNGLFYRWQLLNLKIRLVVDRFTSLVTLLINCPTINFFQFVNLTSPLLATLSPNDSIKRAGIFANVVNPRNYTTSFTATRVRGH